MISTILLQVDIVNSVHQYGWLGSLLIPAVIALWLKLNKRTDELTALHEKTIIDSREQVRVATSMEKLLEALVTGQGRSEDRVTSEIRDQADRLRDLIIQSKNHALKTLETNEHSSAPAA